MKCLSATSASAAFVSHWLNYKRVEDFYSLPIYIAQVDLRISAVGY
jgi:hypothetical protein